MYRQFLNVELSLVKYVNQPSFTIVANTYLKFWCLLEEHYSDCYFLQRCQLSQLKNLQTIKKTCSLKNKRNFPIKLLKI